MAKNTIQYVRRLWNKRTEFFRDLFSMVLMDRYNGYRVPIAILQNKASMRKNNDSCTGCVNLRDDVGGQEEENEGGEEEKDDVLLLHLQALMSEL